jgi:MFS family permease
VLVLGLLLEACTAAAMGAVPVRPHAAWAYLALRCAQGAGAALSYTALLAFAAERFRGSLATVIGIQEAVAGVGYMLGPPVGGVLFALGGFPLPFVAMGAGLLAALPLLPSALPENSGIDEAADTCSDGGDAGARARAAAAQPCAPEAHAHTLGSQHAAASSSSSFLRVAMLPPVLNAAAVTLLAGVAFGFVGPTLAPHLASSLRASEGVIGALFGLCAAAYAAAAPAAGAAADALGARRVMTAGIAALALAYLLLGPSPLLGPPPAPGAPAAWASQVAALLLLGAGAAAAIIPCLPLMEREAAQATAASAHSAQSAHAGGGAESVAALFNGVYCAGEAAGPLVGSALVGALGFRWAATAVGGLLAAYAGAAALSGGGAGCGGVRGAAEDVVARLRVRRAARAEGAHGAAAPLLDDVSEEDAAFAEAAWGEAAQSGSVGVDWRWRG